MKRISKTLSVLLAVLMLAAVCAVSVYAEATPTDVLVATPSDVSSSDAVSGADVAPAVPLSEYELAEVNVEQFGFSINAPKLNSSITAASGAAEVAAFLGEGAGVENMFDITDGYTAASYSYIYYAASDDDSINIVASYCRSVYNEYIGSYASLSAEEQETLRDSSDLIGNGSKVELRTVNGVPFLFQEVGSVADQYYYAMMRTVVGGGAYDVTIYMNAPTEADIDAADAILQSVKVDGFDRSGTGLASSGVTTVLIVLVCLLFVAVLLLIFFLVRFALYAKAANSSFSVVGFDLPRANVACDAQTREVNDNDAD